MAGSSNFLQWNPNAQNLESDSQYASDSQRLSGAVDNTAFLSNLANKLFVQLSWFVSALAQSLSNKGYVVSDSNYTQLVNVLGNIVTQADSPSPFVLVPYNSNLTLNASGPGDRVFSMTLTGNVNSLALTGCHPGQEITFIFFQDGTGNRALNGLGINVLGFGGISQTPNSGCMQKFICVDGNNTVGASAPMSVFQGQS